MNLKWPSTVCDKSTAGIVICDEDFQAIIHIVLQAQESKFRSHADGRT